MLPIMLLQQARAEAVLLGHRLDAEPAALHQRELGRDVERVGGEQQEREQQVECSRTHVCLATAPALRDARPLRRRSRSHPDSFCCRKSRTSAGSTSFATNARPIRLQQDEGQLAALDLLVLRHQRHQRVGIRQPVLGEACDVLQIGSAGRRRQGGGRRGAASAVGDHAELRGEFARPAPCRWRRLRRGTGGRKSRSRPPAHGRRCGRD